MAIDKITLQATDNLFVNTEITGTEAAKMPVGTTAERANAQSGDIRFNSSTALMEYYDGVQWKSIDAPPLVSSISPTTESDPNANITITGSNFATSVTVKFVGNDGTEYSSPSVTRNSVTEVVATTPATALSVANEPYDVVVTNNSSSLSGTLADALDAGGVPAFNESSGSLGTVYDSARTGLSFDAGAVDPDSDTITYSVSVGALPSGLSLNTSTGAITGDANAVGSDTTSTFTISAATSSDTSTREFSITVAAPVITSYTSTGSGTFSVPSGLTAVDVLVVAGGGGGGGDNGGGGGAGGLIYRPAFPVTSGGSVSYTVGSSGTGIPGPDHNDGKGGNGQDSVFGTLTAKGGGGGGSAAAAFLNGNPGGSGGGGGGEHPAPNGSTGGTGTQPQQPGESGQSQYGFGNPGGTGTPAGGGGGGAAAAGQAESQQPTDEGGDGGNGKSYSISGSPITYAGGGGGGNQNAGPANRPSGGSGGGGDGGTGAPTTYQGIAATANRGGGGGGGGNDGPQIGDGAPGGSGIVIVKY